MSKKIIITMLVSTLLLMILFLGVLQETNIGIMWGILSIHFGLMGLHKLVEQDLLALYALLRREK